MMPIASHFLDSLGDDSAMAKFVAALSLPRATRKRRRASEREIGRLVATLMALHNCKLCAETFLFANVEKFFFWLDNYLNHLELSFKIIKDK